MPSRRHILLGSAVLLFSHAAYAQDAAIPAAAPPVAASQPDKHIYVLADFARFAPQTALDMLGQVPGFKFQGASQDRGIGEATENVLINGQRIANKTGGAIAELSRIAAKQVERIEIVDGASLDIAGLTGQVANVVTKARSKGSGQFSWNPRLALHYEDPAFARGNISYSGKSGKVGYTLSIDTGAGSAGDGGPTIVYDGGGKLIENRHEVSRFDGFSPIGSSRITLDGPVSASLNLSYQNGRNNSTNAIDTMPVAGGASSSLFTARETASNFEVGSDLTFKALGGKLKLISLVSRHDSDSTNSGTTIVVGAPTTGSRIDGNSHSGETVGRAEYGLKWGGADVKLSAEAAYNSLDASSRLFQLDTAGTFTEIPFPGATLKVTESRYELVGSWGRPIAKGMTLQLVAGGEHSTLSAGPVSRDFLRYKGSASLAWQAGPRSDINLNLTRAVGQLNFFQFLASINLVDDRQTAGNTRLVPAQSWVANIELNRKLGAWGSTRVQIYGSRIDDLIETIPVSGGGQALGNVDHAGRYGIEWQTTLLLDRIGWKGARVDTTVNLQGSHVRDPLTGIPRTISYDLVRLISTSLRHDIARSNWAWGANLNSFRSAPGVQLTEISRSWSSPAEVGVFVENKNIFGLKVRASVDNIDDARNRRDRTVYNGWRTDPVLLREVQNRLAGATVRFSVNGNF